MEALQNCIISILLNPIEREPSPLIIFEGKCCLFATFFSLFYRKDFLLIIVHKCKIKLEIVNKKWYSHEC